MVKKGANPNTKVKEPPIITISNQFEVLSDIDSEGEEPITKESDEDFSQYWENKQTSLAFAVKKNSLGK